MLSNPPTSCVHKRQQLHRRQNSTPVAFESAEVPNFPVTAPGLSRHNSHSHRRGQSLDQRSPIRRRPSPDTNRTQYTNPGQEKIQQHILQEAQQQRLARPGQPQQYQQLTNISPGTQCGPTDQQLLHMNEANNLYMNTGIMQSMSQISGNPQFGSVQELTPTHSFDMSNAAGYFEGFGLGLDQEPQSQSSQPAQQPLIIQTQENVIAEHARRLSQHSNMNVQYQRPTTPLKQINAAHFPLTPGTTPFRKSAEVVNGIRTAESSPTKQRYGGDTLKPLRSTGMQRGRSLQGIFENSAADAPSPPKTAPLTSSTFDLAVMPSSLEEIANMPVNTTYYTGSPNHSPTHPLSPLKSSFNSSPQIDGLPIFENTSLETSSSISLPSRSPVILSVGASPAKGPSSPKGSMSITDLNLTPDVDAAKVETGVTMDDIETYMEGPDPIDNKFVCRYPDCNKRFGRRENIKSHIQTHLNDRQYQCLYCGSKFVRGHDLKRHAKTHEGKKPFVCLCGNGFGRPDALTRHRQRNMCIGAIDGIVKKEVRRGRPPKYSSAQEARKEKVRRTKERNRANAAAHAHSSSLASTATFPSSVSVSSNSEYNSNSPPPSSMMDNLSLIDPSSPINDLEVMIRDSSPLVMGGDNYAFPPGVFSFTPPTSPGFSTGNKPSPHRSHSSSLTSIGLGRSDTIRSPKRNQLPTNQEHAAFDSNPWTAEARQIFENATSSSFTVHSPHEEPLPSSPPDLQGLSEASSPFTDEEMDAFLEKFDDGQNGPTDLDEIFGSTPDNANMYSGDFFEDEPEPIW